jgi:hypothetical protein
MRLIVPRLPGVFSIAAVMIPLSTSAQPANTTDIARVHHACTAIMGLNPLDWPYHICVSSLKLSLRHLHEGRVVETDRSRCLKQGLQPGTPAFADCVVGVNQSTAGVGR